MHKLRFEFNDNRLKDDCVLHFNYLDINVIDETDKSFTVIDDWNRCKHEVNDIVSKLRIILTRRGFTSDQVVEKCHVNMVEYVNKLKKLMLDNSFTINLTNGTQLYLENHSFMCPNTYYFEKAQLHLIVDEDVAVKHLGQKELIYCCCYDGLSLSDLVDLRLGDYLNEDQDNWGYSTVDYCRKQQVKLVSHKNYLGDPTENKLVELTEDDFDNNLVVSNNIHVYQLPNLEDSNENY